MVAYSCESTVTVLPYAITSPRVVYIGAYRRESAGGGYTEGTKRVELSLSIDACDDGRVGYTSDGSALSAYLL
jgi:hypothetical protein